MSEDERPWSRRETAAFLGVPPSTLAKWAAQQSGPAYRLVGVHARYLPSEVRAWLEQLPQRGGAPSPAA